MIVGKSVILQRYRSPCGEMMLGAIGDSICLCGWIGRSGYERDLARVTKHFGACVVHGTCPVIDIAAEQLDEYFAGGETGACWDSMGGIKQCRNLHFRAGRQD